MFSIPATSTTELCTLSLHDALPILLSDVPSSSAGDGFATLDGLQFGLASTLAADLDRKSTRLNSSHSQISYAVFSLKKKITLHYPLCAGHPPTSDQNL